MRASILLGGDHARELLGYYIGSLGVGKCICLAVMFDIAWAALRLAISIWPLQKQNPRTLTGQHSGHPVEVSYYPAPQSKCRSSPWRPRIRLLGGTGLTLTTSYAGESTLNLVLAGMARLDVRLSTGIISLTVAPGLRAPQDLKAVPSGEYFQKSTT